VNNEEITKETDLRKLEDRDVLSEESTGEKVWCEPVGLDLDEDVHRE
jgi:hypothetical protein